MSQKFSLKQALECGCENCTVLGFAHQTYFFAHFFMPKDEADTPLHLACCYQQLPTIELLLQVG
jgi:hypothetical protein